MCPPVPILKVLTIVITRRTSIHQPKCTSVYISVSATIVAKPTAPWQNNNTNIGGKTRL